MSKCCKIRKENSSCAKACANDDARQGVQKDSRRSIEQETTLKSYHEGAQKVSLGTVVPKKTSKFCFFDQQCRDQKQQDEIICFCFSVSRDALIDAIKGGKTTFEQLQEALLVGTGCQRCAPDVQKIIDEVIREQA